MSHILQKVAPIGESRDKELLKSASTYIYATRDGEDLLAHVFFPADTAGVPRPAVAFFHGGFWDTQMVTQFVPHCHHFAGRGAVAVTFTYRTGAPGNGKPLEALEDAEAAMAWLYENAETLGIDVSNVALGGASGGAYLALLLVMRKEKTYTPPFLPKALVLFSALVNTGPKGQLGDRFPDAKTAKLLSPASLLNGRLPAMLFLHGKSDRVTPYEEVASFCRRLRWRRNKVQLLDFIGAEHSFFNFNVHHGNFEMTVRAADHFLVEKGVIAPAPEED